MSDINHRMVVEQHGGDIRYTPQSSDIRVHVRLPMDSSVEGRLRETWCVYGRRLK
jgi:hypothetical protein